MRVKVFIPLVLTITYLCGCDTVGQRRIHLQLQAAKSQTTDAIAIDHTDEAIAILNKVAVQQGYQRVESEPGYVCIYSKQLSPVLVEGHTYSRSVSCRVRSTSTGYQITIGEFGLLAASPEAERLFVEVRQALTARYGKRNVESRRLGGAKQKEVVR
jgi:hypothetical protein